METVYLATIVIILLGVLITLRRVIIGPTLVDRILAVNVIGTKTIVLLALLGYLRDREGFFLDIALAYALINFIGTIAVLRLFETKLAESGEKSETA